MFSDCVAIHIPTAVPNHLPIYSGAALQKCVVPGIRNLFFCFRKVFQLRRSFLLSGWDEPPSKLDKHAQKHTHTIAVNYERPPLTS